MGDAVVRTLLRWLLGGVLIAAGVGHLTAQRTVVLDSDAERFARLLFQPVLVIWALGATGAWQAIRAGTWPSTPEHTDG